MQAGEAGKRKYSAFVSVWREKRELCEARAGEKKGMKFLFDSRLSALRLLQSFTLPSASNSKLEEFGVGAHFGKRASLTQASHTHCTSHVYVREPEPHSNIESVLWDSLCCLNSIVSLSSSLTVHTHIDREHSSLRTLSLRDLHAAGVRTEETVRQQREGDLCFFFRLMTLLLIVRWMQQEQQQILRTSEQEK